MKKKSKLIILKNYLLSRRNHQKGFSMLEGLVAITILSIAFGINMQMLALLKIQSLQQEVKTGAIAVSKEILDDLRYQIKDTEGFDSVTFGKTQKKDLTSFGYNYDADLCVCSKKPIIDNNNNISNCATGTHDGIVYIVLHILRTGQENEKTYTVETAFTTVQ